MHSYTEHIIETNLSIAWAKAFLASMKYSEISPMTITVNSLSNDNIPECEIIRSELDSSLKDNLARSCHTVANTIFPVSLWDRNRERNILYQRYLGCQSQIHTDRANCNGVYFERLISYGNGINQLEYIIQTYLNGNHRRSALQASIYDPACDATDQRQRGFPCLQQVGFSRIGKTGLCITGYYPKEYIYDRGYGNYLGLCRLGQFVAKEIGLELIQMTCFVGVAAVGKANKATLRALEKSIQIYVDQYEKG
jgi:thymidylate synthase